jgi:Fe-S-cluster containining protein
VPFDKKFIEKHKPIREVKKQIELGRDVVALETEDFICPYLTPDFECSVYQDRPDICKTYGTEIDPLMTCPYQDKDGRIRSRQERRKIERENDKLFNGVIRRSNGHR